MISLSQVRADLIFCLVLIKQLFRYLISHNQVEKKRIIISVSLIHVFNKVMVISAMFCALAAQIHWQFCLLSLRSNN